MDGLQMPWGRNADRRGRGLSGLRRVMAAGLLAASMLPAAPALANGPESVADLAAGLIDSVVNISTSQTVAGSRGIPAPQAPQGSPFQEFFDDFFNNKKGDNAEPPSRKVQSLGSGFVIDSSGIIITNNHVIEGADEIVANFNDGSKLTATLVGHDDKSDLAVLKVTPPKPLKAVKFGDSDKMRVGDWVMAIGNPFGLGGTVTVGIVSARNRDISSGPYDNFIQTDAAINRGNSGGPLFNMNGEVIGINTAIISPSGGSIGLGFAIPSDGAQHVVEQLRQYGETRRGWLGVRIQEVTDEIAASLQMGPTRGALIAGVTAKGPADAAGIKPGDVVVTFDGKPVHQMRDLPLLVADATIDKTVDVVVIRDGKNVTVPVKIGRLMDAAAADSSSPPKPDTPPVIQAPAVATAFGMTFGDITPDLRQQYSIGPDLKGVLITAVSAGSQAADKGIHVGEVVVEVSQETVGAPADISKRLDALKTDGRKSALFLISTPTGELRFVPLKLDE